MIEEQSLADIPTQPSVVAPQDFSLASFLAGARPSRRRIQLFLGVTDDQLAVLADLADRAEKASDDEADHLVTEFETFRAGLGVWFEVEARSQDWARSFWARARKRFKVGKGKQLTPAQVTAVTLEQLAAQVVTPTDVTGPGLARLRELGYESEVDSLAAVVLELNSSDHRKVLTRDFLPTRSANQETPAG